MFRLFEISVNFRLILLLNFKSSCLAVVKARTKTCMVKISFLTNRWCHWGLVCIQWEQESAFLHKRKYPCGELPLKLIECLSEMVELAWLGNHYLVTELDLILWPWLNSFYLPRIAVINKPTNEVTLTVYFIFIPFARKMKFLSWKFKLPN